jgi:hypothetical protein
MNTTRIWDVNYRNCLWLEPTEAGLDLVADVDGRDLTVSLDRRQANKLRLALARLEKQWKDQE